MAGVKYITRGVVILTDKTQTSLHDDQSSPNLEFGVSNGFKRRVRLSQPAFGALSSTSHYTKHHIHHKDQHHALASLTAAIPSFSRIHSSDDQIFWNDDALGLEATIAANKLLQPINLHNAQTAILQFGADLSRQLDCCKLLVAGAASAVVSRTCVAPLERVKMDLVLKSGTGEAWSTAVQVFSREGVPGFWRGNVVNLVRTAPFKAVNFFSFEVYRKMLSTMYGPDAWTLRYLAGACAGITATLACFPLDVVRMRLMAPGGHKYGGMLATLSGIVRCEGWQALYAGCVPAVIGMAPAGAVYYGVYDNLKTSHLRRLQQEQEQQQGEQVPVELPALYTLLYGAVAGAASEAIVYPLEVLRRQMQLQGMASAAVAASKAAHHSSRVATLPHGAGGLRPNAAFGRLAAAFWAIWATEGIKGFYSGIVPNMLQVLPSAALGYYTYEGVKKVLNAQC